MNVKKLIFHSTPAVTFGGNTFINVPTILQFDDTPLVTVVRGESLGFSTEFQIYDADGTYLAKVRGNRAWPTDQGKKAGIVIRELPQLWVCEVGGRTAFEIRQQRGDAFRAQAELYTPGGYLVRVSDQSSPALFDASGGAIQVRGATIIGSQFTNCRIGVWIRSDGTIALGVG